MVLRLSECTPRAPPYWLMISGACVVPALLNAFTSYLSARVAGRASTDWSTVVFAGAIWLCFGFITPIPYVLARRYPLRSVGIKRFLQAHLSGALLLCFLWTSLGVSMALLLNRKPAFESLPRYSASWILLNLPWSIFLYFAVLGSIYAFTYYREAREREAQQAQLTAQLAEARLGALRMQLNPHFLFNRFAQPTICCSLPTDN
ncbi:MAG TPA: hypothetical protein VGQ39_11530 [Pyrinomonadaceae bacterium]|nr:hypothetical protein [Pyrinomonadaceae bacterium]